MNEEQIRNLIQKEILLSQNRARYDISNTVFHDHNGIDSPKILFDNLSNSPNSFCRATTTTGTTAVNVFSSGGANFKFTITGVFLISNDTTAGNISLLNNGTSVCILAKGTVAGTMVGATSLQNAGYVKGNPITVVSSSVGNATLFMTFTL